jgi:aminopeptidase-like protein
MTKKNTRRMRHNDFIPAGLEEEDLTSPTINVVVMVRVTG